MILQVLFYVLGDDIDGHHVGAAFRNDDIGVTFGRFNKLQMTWPHRLLVASQNCVDITAPLHHVTLYHPGEAKVCLTIHKYPDIH